MSPAPTVVRHRYVCFHALHDDWFAAGEHTVQRRVFNVFDAARFLAHEGVALVSEAGVHRRKLDALWRKLHARSVGFIDLPAEPRYVSRPSRDPGFLDAGDRVLVLPLDTGLLFEPGGPARVACWAVTT